MTNQVRLLMIAAGVALLGMGLVAGVWWTRASGQSAGTPFMGLADPDAPYDQRFIDEMVMHHQGAIMSARMMIGESARPELRDLARRIIEGQQRQIDQMRAWRAQWYGSADVPTAGMDPMGAMMSGSSMMGGRGMGGIMGGDTSDRMFLRMMIPHHQLAIDMAEDALVNAGHDEIKSLAREIIADQSAEIREMEGYLRDWYGESSTRGTAAGMRDMMRRMMGW